MKRKRIVAANWKMNINVTDGVRLAEVLSMANTDSNVQIAICAPFTHLAPISTILAGGEKMMLGAQNVSEHESGAFTGEISVDMLKDIGVETVIVGHSERRSLYGESDVMINQKLKLLLANGMTPILCCGESQEEREKNNQINYVIAQLTAALAEIQSHEIDNLVIAYEPVWAIGTGLTASPPQVQEMHAAIRLFLARRFDGDTAQRTPILYGGSVKAANATELFSQNDVDGGLVGGASLSAQEFAEIINSFS